ncbi:hypothetical protein L3Q82_013011 [Scortum barcoo]|uniref:Uncharacterized protein n=1 Tax=Scortum barcoo TaxID=214431 RepID=A0ACB8VYT3_9TELE|nr:hypothetical protein L3Q82_013011 [Scortum barcoo]
MVVSASSSSLSSAIKLIKVSMDATVSVILLLTDNGTTYVLQKIAKTWTDAQIFCKENGSVLAYIPDAKTNTQITELMSASQTTEAWFGLRRPQLWYWSDGGWSYTYKNWQPGQPDNLYGNENCAVVGMKNGTWSDENCNNLFPFFCYGAVRTWKTVVSLKIQSSANMEDPLYIADLQEQLRAKFVNQGFTGIKLTWRKLPVMQTQKSTDDTDTAIGVGRKATCLVAAGRTDSHRETGGVTESGPTVAKMRGPVPPRQNTN